VIIDNATVDPAVTAAFGYASEQVGACHAEGAADWVACDFLVQGHSGGTIHLADPVPCFSNTYQGFNTATQDTVDWTPSGEIHLACYFPPTTMG
jgi:hypothetical protein